MKKTNKLLLVCVGLVITITCYHSEVEAKDKSSTSENNNKITYVYVGKEIPKNVQNYHKSKEWVKKKLKHYDKNYKKNKTNKNTNNIKNKTNTNVKKASKKVNEHNHLKTNNMSFKHTNDSNHTSTKIKDNQLKLDNFIYNGILYHNHRKFTYASQSVVPGRGLNIPGRHVEDGFVVDKDNYIVLGARPEFRHKVYETPFGRKGKVYDAGSFDNNHLNVYLE